MAQNNKELQEAKKLLEDINLLRAKLNQAPKIMSDSEAVQNLQSLRNELKGVQNSFEDIDDSATSLYDQIKAISSEFKGQPSELQKIRGAMRKITSIAEDLKMNEQGIKDLSSKNLDDLTLRLKENRKILDDSTKSLVNSQDLSRLAQEDIKAVEEHINLVKTGNTLTEEQLDTALASVQAAKNLTDEQKAAYALFLHQGNALNDLNGKIEGQKEHQKEINKLMGVGGAIIGGIDGLMSKLGMNSGIFKQRVEEANKAMKDQAEKIKASGVAGGKLSVLMAGLGPLAKGFGEALLDPLSLILKIVDAFFKVDKASTDVQRLTGQNSDAIAGANMRYATSVDYLNTISELTKQTGMSAQNIFSPQVIAGAAELKNTMGLAADEAGGLAIMAQTTSGDIDKTVDSIVDQTSAFNKANRSAVNQNQVLKDVAKTSDGIKASLGGNPAVIAKAASAARRLGMELGQLDKIAGSLLDFEDSIGKEMEAELLLGKDLNLNKARELALNNDLAGVGNELFKNSADINEFGKMNRIQQESYAAALGMTRDELGKIAYQKAIEAGMTEEQAAAAAGVRAEDMKRAEIQEQIQKSVDKLAQAFAPILSIVGDIVGILAPAVQILGGIVGYVVKFLDSLGIIKPLIIGIVAVMAMGKIASFFGSATAGAMKFAESIKGMKFSFSGMMDSVKSWGAGIKDAFKGGMTGAGKLADTVKDKAGEVTKDAAGRFRDAKGRFAKAPGTDKAVDIVDKAKDNVTDKAVGATDKTVEASNAASKAEDPKSSGEKLKEFFTNLAAGLKEMASMEVVGGALALIPASIGLVAFIPGYLGAKLLERLDGEKFRTSLEGLAFGLQAMASSKVLLGSLALIAASVGLIAMIPGVVGGLLLAASATPIATGLGILAGGLVAFGTAMASGVGLLGLAALVGAVIGLGFALGIAAPGIEAFGTVITSVFAGLATLVTSVAAGFVTLMDSVSLEKVMNMALLGPALISAAVGLTAFSAAMAAGSMASGITSFLTGGGLLSDLQTLVEMAGPLQSVATSLTAIAGALAGIGVALATVETDKLEEMGDLVMTTAFAAPAVAAAGAIGDMIAGITGSGGGEKSESNDKLIAKIDELIVAVKQGKNINMDGRRVGATLQLSASNT
jgi:hypothetical protein